MKWLSEAELAQLAKYADRVEDAFLRAAIAIARGAAQTADRSRRSVSALDWCATQYEAARTRSLFAEANGLPKPPFGADDVRRLQEDQVDRARCAIGLTRHDRLLLAQMRITITKNWRGPAVPAAVALIERLLSLGTLEDVDGEEEHDRGPANQP